MTTILFIGCNKSQEDSENKNSSITINKIEHDITNKQTSFGCQHKKNSKSKECTEEEIDSATFILSTLNKDSNNQEETNISSIKERLNISLKEIEEEVNKKSKLKDNLEALVNELSENKKKKLEDFVNQIDDSDFKDVEENRIDSSSNKISIIKDELKNLTTMEDIIANNLKELVKDAEERDTPSVKKFASAMIEDVSSKTISIIKEDEDFFNIKVQKGENLSVLAKRYYNDESKYKLIYEANKDKISSKYEIYPGTELLIPKI